MLKAIIFDLNGIFIESPLLSKRFERDFGISTEEFLPVLSQVMKQTRQPGAASVYSYWQPHLSKWGINLNESEFLQYWFKEEVPNQTVIQFAKDLRQKGIKVFILSNNFKERAQFYGHFQWISEVVDKAYFSYTTGLVKPDPKSWELILSENNLVPSDCIYFDDQQKNVDAAAIIGIKSFVYENFEEMQKIIGQIIS